MTDKSKIEWTDHTFNPWIGCTRVSPGCDHCYAATQNDFRKWNPGGWEPGAPRKKTKTYGEPLKWQRHAKQFFETHGRRQRVFCASLADVMDNKVPADWRVELWNLIRDCSDLDWQLLTKRPQNIAAMLPPDWGAGWPHVWLGTTTENQEEADRRIPILVATPAAKRFISAEPLLGPINLFDYIGPWGPEGALQAPPQLDWVIAGGESGPGARPMHPRWARFLRDQCVDAGVPFFFKQWGEWSIDWERAHDPDDRRLPSNKGPTKRYLNFAGGHGFHGKALTHAVRVGKKRAGRLLDGVEHSEFPA